MEVVKLNGALGAHVIGIDWAGGLLDSDFTLFADALAEHSVLAVDAAAMRPEQHVQLARHSASSTLLNRTTQHHGSLARGDKSNMWHIDEQYLTRPPIITMTHSLQAPSWGGDTAFISLHAAYDALSANMDRYLDGLTAVHDHGVVLVHPVTGRKALYVSPTYTRFIQGIPMAERIAA